MRRLGGRKLILLNVNDISGCTLQFPMDGFVMKLEDTLKYFRDKKSHFSIQTTGWRCLFYLCQSAEDAATRCPMKCLPRPIRRPFNRGPSLFCFIGMAKDGFKKNEGPSTKASQMLPHNQTGP